MEASVPNDSVVSVELIDNDLSKWKLLLRFNPETELQKDLSAYGAHLADPKKKALEVHLHFPPDYPDTPPEALIIEPRLAYDSCSFVSFGGKVFTPHLSGDWKPESTVKGVVLPEIVMKLLGCNARVDCSERTLRPYHPKPLQQEPVSYMPSSLPTINKFHNFFTMVAAGTVSGEVQEKLQKSDRVSFSTAMMEELYGEDTKLPLMFEILTPNGHVRHAGISDTMPFVDFTMKDRLIVPDWIMDEFRYELTTSPTVKVRCVELKSAERVLLQPRSLSFYDDIKDEAALNRAVANSNLTAFTAHSGVQIRVPQTDRVHMMEVLDVYPQGAAKLISAGNSDWEIECKVTFAPAPDFEDSEDKAARTKTLAENRQKAEKTLQKRAQEEESRKREAVMNNIVMTRCELEDSALRSVGKSGSIDVKLTFPDGTSLDGKFVEGKPVSDIAAFVLMSSDWVLQELVPLADISFTSTYPRRKLVADEPITKQLHRSRLIVEKRDPEDSHNHAVTSSSTPPRQVEPTPVDDHDDGADEDYVMDEDHELDDEDGFVDDHAPFEAQRTTSSTFAPSADAPTDQDLEAAWQKSREMQEVRKSLRSAESAKRPLSVDDAFAASRPRTEHASDENGHKVEQVRAVVGSSIDAAVIRSILESCGWDVESAIHLVLEMDN